MKIQEQKHGKKVQFGNHEYEVLVRAAPSLEAELVVRLAGECGLKLKEMPMVDLQNLRDCYGGLYFLHLPAQDATDRGRPRDAVMTPPVVGLLYQMVRDGGKIIDVTPRSLQNWIEKAREAAFELTDVEEYRYISARDLRSYFARRMVETFRVHPPVVMKIGGWDKVEPFMDHLSDPTGDMIEYECGRMTDRARMD